VEDDEYSYDTLVWCRPLPAPSSLPVPPPGVGAGAELEAPSENKPLYSDE
jgi:hypothetical protein